MKNINRKQLNMQLKKKLRAPFIYAYGVEGSGKETAIKNYLKSDKQLNYQWFKLKGGETKQDIWKMVYRKVKERYHLTADMASYPLSEPELRTYSTCFGHYKNTFVFVFQGGSDTEVDILFELFWELTDHGRNLLKIILIQSTAPKRKALRFIQNHNCEIISPANFFFSKTEIRLYYESQGQTFEDKDVDMCHYVTNGWIAMMETLDIHQAGNVPITQVRDLLEKILTEYFSIKQLSSLMKISFLETFELDQVFFLTKDKGLTVKILSLADNGLIFQEGNGFENFYILPPFRKLLLQKLNSSRVKREELNRMHLQWLLLKKRFFEALFFAYEVKDFQTIMLILDQYPNSLYYDQEPELMAAIYEELPRDMLLQHIYVYMQVMEDYLLILNPQKGVEMLFIIQDYIQNNKNLDDDHQSILGELELIIGYTTYNNLYEMCVHFKKAYDCLYPNVSKLSKPDMVISFGSPHVLYQYLTTPGDSRHLIAFMSKEIIYYSSITQGLNCAIELQAQAEYELETGRYGEARITAEKAYHKAFNQKIRYMCVCSMFTIGRASIMMHDAYNYERAIHLLQKEKARCQNMILLKEIESAMAYLLSLKPMNHVHLRNLNDHDLELDILDADHNSFSYIAQGQIYIFNNQYDKLYTLSQKMTEHYRSHSHVFGVIYTELYKAISLFYMGRVQESLDHMALALQMSEADQFTTPFVEQCTVIQDILKQMNTTKLLKKIDKEIQGYLKYKIFHFNEKERQIYAMHHKGYTRSAIAEEMNMTIYAVKYYLQNIKKKTNSRMLLNEEEDTLDAE